jgi:hypothetical protein
MEARRYCLTASLAAALPHSAFRTEQYPSDHSRFCPGEAAKSVDFWHYPHKREKNQTPPPHKTSGRNRPPDYDMGLSLSSLDGIDVKQPVYTQEQAKAIEEAAIRRLQADERTNYLMQLLGMEA